MLLLQNGLIIDGSGSAAFAASVLTNGNRIADVGNMPAPAGCTVLDCSGLAIAPGFIDLHSHLDLQGLEDRMDKIRQGVTSEVVGNCGFSPFPFAGSRQGLQEFASGILGSGDAWGLSTAGE